MGFKGARKALGTALGTGYGGPQEVDDNRSSSEWGSSTELHSLQEYLTKTMQIDPRERARPNGGQEGRSDGHQKQKYALQNAPGNKQQDSVRDEKNVQQTAKWQMHTNEGGAGGYSTVGLSWRYTLEKQNKTVTHVIGV